MAKPGICEKCGRSVTIVSKGRCYSCVYGSGRNMTKEEVMELVAKGEYALMTGRRVNTPAPRTPVAQIEISGTPLKITLPPAGLSSLLPINDKRPLGMYLDFSGNESLLEILQHHNVTGPEIINVLALISTGNYELRRRI